MLRSLKIENFRCFKVFELQPLGQLNLLVGANNSGKTSILEAIRLLLGSSYNFEFLSELMLRRSEYAWDERQKNTPLLDVSHLFYGHRVDHHDQFSIFATTGESSFNRKLVVSIQDDPEGVSSFDDQLNDISELYLSFRWSQMSDMHTEIPTLRVPIFDFKISLDYLNGLRWNASKQLINIQFVSSSSLTTSRMLYLFDQVVLTAEETVLYEALRAIEPDIERLASVSTERYRYLGEHGGFVVKLSSEKQRVPIGCMGDGMWRMLGLALAIINAKDGVLLVDEIDTGLHFSAMSDMWRLIWEAAKRLNVQVFATTHNSDCWTSLAAIANTDNQRGDGITIQRIEKGKSHSVVFSERQIAIAAERGIEVR